MLTSIVPTLVVLALPVMAIDLAPTATVPIDPVAETPVIPMKRLGSKDANGASEKGVIPYMAFP
jgi:hypothetical protein